jgi:lantibiotic modifying enzyme
MYSATQKEVHKRMYSATQKEVRKHTYSATQEEVPKHMYSAIHKLLVTEIIIFHEYTVSVIGDFLLWNRT